MDNLTHSLTGLAMGRAGLDRLCPRSTVLLLLSANAPDLDVVSRFSGQLSYLEHHRGYSHSILFLPVMALVPMLLVAAIFRERLPWLRAWLICCLGVASHLLLDWTNSYGVRFLLPFNSSWYHLDLNSLWDGVILVVLVFAVVWPLLSRLVSEEIGGREGRGRGIAIFALAFFLLYDCGRAVLHSQVIEQLDARIYNGEAPRITAALPDSVNPMSWRAIVETNETFRGYHVRAFSEFDPNSAEVFFKRRDRPDVASALQTEPFRYFMYFARFPAWFEAPASGEGAMKQVQATDLRFGSPGGKGWRTTALEDEQNRVIRSWFSF